MKLLTPSVAKRISFPIPLPVFWENLQDGPNPLMMSHHAFHSGVRPRRLWESRGRETLRVEKCQAFATQLARELCKKKSIPLIVRHYNLPWRWFPSNDAQRINLDDKAECELRKRAVNYLSGIMPENFAGVIQLDSHHEAKTFLMSLLASPTVFACQNIYLFSMTVPLVVELNHHADIICYSTATRFLPKFHTIT